MDIVCSGQEDALAQLSKLRSKVAVFLLTFIHFKLRCIPHSFCLYSEERCKSKGCFSPS